MNIKLPLMRFLLVFECPPEWKKLDLYLFRDEQTVFYVGQSYCAHTRVWEHLLSGFKGHSIMGRFIWCNWPAAMRFTVELMSSRDEDFAEVGHNLTEAEALLIRKYNPVFNVSLNDAPQQMPVGYNPVNAPLTCPRSLSRILHEVERIVKVEDEREWKKNLDDYPR